MKTHETNAAHVLQRERRWQGWMGCVAAATLVLAACSAADADRANRAAEVILTRTSNGTVEAGSASTASPSTATAPTTAGASTSQASTGRVTATPSLVYARCLAREANNLRREPSASAQVVVELAARDIFTAYGRTLDTQWVLGWKNTSDFGWTSAANTACTVPIAELMPAEPNALLLTPVAVAAAATATPPAADTTPVPSPSPLTDTPAPVVETPAETAPTEAATATTAATATATTAVELPTTPSTATALAPVRPVLVTVTPMGQEPPAPAPTIAPSTATDAGPTAPVVGSTDTPPMFVTQVQMVTVVVTVTVTPNVPTATPTPLVIGQMNCEVTPGTPVNFRRGPARTERLIGTLTAGTSFLAQGRNEDGSWLFGLGPQNTPGWLISTSVSCNGDTTKLAVVDR